MNRTGWTCLLVVAGAIGVVLLSSVQSKAASDSGVVSIHRMGGDIDVADAPNGAKLHTMGGSIHLGKVRSFATVGTMGGSVEIDDAQGPVKADTMGGNITLKSVDGPIHASTMGGNITVRETGTSSGGRDIELSSKGGTVQLTVPKDFPMQVRITLAYTKNAPEHYRIIEHAGLTQHESADWDRSIFTPRKYIRAEGTVGNGSNRITIETVNGDVILRQE